MNQLTEEMRLRLSVSLRHFRHLHDLSQAQAAEIAGIQKNAYTKAENGKTEPRMEWVGQLCAFYDIKPYRLFEPLEQADVAFRANRHRSESEKARQIETVHRAIQWAQDYHWLSEVLGEKPLPLPDVSGLSPKQAAQKTLDVIWYGGLPLPEAFPDTLARYGVAVCTDPFLDTETFGFSRQVQDCGWLIAVDGAERIPPERKYWTAAHELGHILLGTDSKPHEKGSDAEDDASAFASELLMPDAQFRLLWKDSAARPFYERIIRIKHVFRVPADMVLYRLTEGKNSDLEKALALRDYLRENIPYNLYSDPIPEGRECADYFVFELKTGHCEYYATALAVMARLAGLPSRVATGFSPGNYNTLMNQFEVYEYHAHAWTQIFIEDRGWLTFDATPPQQLVSRTTPAGIGTLRDPFGDEWKMTPPELTERTQTYARELYREKMKEKSVELTKVDEIIAKTLFKEEEKQKAADIRKPVPEKGLAGRLNQFLRESNRKLRDLLDDAMDFTAENGGLLLVLLLPLLSILLLLRILVVALRQHLLQKRAMSFFAKARDLSLTPGERVRALYWGTRLLLNRANLPRKHNQELLEYADSLTKTDPVLARNTAAVFEAFYQLEYGGYAFDEFDVRNLFGKVRPVRKSLLRIIRGGR